jgi:general stress protein 26
MKCDPQLRGDLRHLGDLLEDIEVAMLTTHAADGSLVTRPLQTLALDGNGELVFFTAASSHKVDELTDIAVFNLASAPPGAQRYASGRGPARIDRDRATIEALWSLPQTVFFPQGKDDPDLVVLRVRVRDAVYWESAGNFVARALDFAQGLLSDEPADLGHRGRLSGTP